MLQGVIARLHEGTICHISGEALDDEESGKSLDGVRCSIQSFDPAASKWRVRLEGRAWNGRELLDVDEGSLRIGHCLLPSALDEEALEIYCTLSFEDAQGDCGRGLVVTQPVKAGQPIFEEAPFIVCSSWGDRRHGATSNEHHAERWLAYCALEAHARREREDSGDEDRWATALSAFHDLGYATDVPSHVRAGADHICARHARTVFGRQGRESSSGNDVGSSGGSSNRSSCCDVPESPNENRIAAETAAAHPATSPSPTLQRLQRDTSPSPSSPSPLQRVIQVLMRFNCNQFGLSNSANGASSASSGAPGSGGPFCASALYAFTSRVNHSCDPSLAMASKEAHLMAYGRPFDVSKDGGKIVAYATRDVSAERTPKRS